MFAPKEAPTSPSVAAVNRTLFAHPAGRRPRVGEAEVGADGRPRRASVAIALRKVMCSRPTLREKVAAASNTALGTRWAQRRKAMRLLTTRSDSSVTFRNTRRRLRLRIRRLPAFVSGTLTVLVWPASILKRAFP